MGTIITAKDIASNVQKINNLTTGVKQSELNQGLDGIKDLMHTVRDILTQFLEIKKQTMGNQQVQQQTQGFKLPPTSQLISQSPNQQPASPPQPEPPKEEKKEVKPMKIEPSEIKKGIYNLLKEQAKKLPSDLKQKKIEEVIGDNFDTFTFKYLGMEIDSEKLLDVLATAVLKQINKFTGGEIDVEQTRTGEKVEKEKPENKE